MEYKDYIEILDKNDLVISSSDGIIYKTGEKNKNRPICNNTVFQDLVIKKQEENIIGKEYELLGNCIMTLIRIVLNNVKFRYQPDNIREDIVTEAYVDIFTALQKKCFDPTKGNAYSYFFRLAYVSGIHVLEKYNKIRETEEKLVETFMEMYIVNDGRKIETNFV